MLFSIQPQPGAHGTLYLLINMHVVSTMLDSRLFHSEMVLSSLSNVVNLFLKKKNSNTYLGAWKFLLFFRSAEFKLFGDFMRKAK